MQWRDQGVDLNLGAPPPHEAVTGSLFFPSNAPKRQPATGSPHPALGRQARWAHPANADAGQLGPAPLGGGSGPTRSSQLGAANRPEPVRGAVTAPLWRWSHPGVGTGYARSALASGLPADGYLWILRPEQLQHLQLRDGRLWCTDEKGSSLESAPGRINRTIATLLDCA